MQDEGYELDIPEEFRWKRERIEDPDFVLKLNAANEQLLKTSLARLYGKGREPTEKLREEQNLRKLADFVVSNANKRQLTRKLSRMHSAILELDSEQNATFEPSVGPSLGAETGS